MRLTKQTLASAAKAAGLLAALKAGRGGRARAARRTSELSLSSVEGALPRHPRKRCWCGALCQVHRASIGSIGAVVVGDEIQMGAACVYDQALFELSC